MRAILRLLSGVGLVLLGITGLILPVMPGWVFLIPGLIILGDYFPPVRRLLGWARANLAAGIARRKSNTPAPKC